MDFYHRSACILDALDAKKGSVKGLAVKKAKKPGEAGRFMRIIIQVLEYRPVINQLIEHSRLLTEEKALFIAPSANAAQQPPSSSLKQPTKPGSAHAALKQQAQQKQKKQHQSQNGNNVPSPANLAQVLVHDLVFAKRGIVLAKEHKIRKRLELYKDDLLKELARERKKRKVPDNEALKVTLPEQVAASVQTVGKGKKRQREDEEAAAGVVRWLRINTLKWSTEDAVEWFENERWELADDIPSLVARAHEKSKVFALDDHIEPLLALPISTVLSSLAPYREGQLIAQDKASCMSAWVLLSEYYADWLEMQSETGDYDAVEAQRKQMAIRVMDATAAPGNKTTMAAALAGLHSRVFAVERDSGRHKVLKDMCAKAGAVNVQTLHTDFLSIKPDDQRYKNVSHLLVDPSCSGSGIPNRLDHLVSNTASDASTPVIDEKRIKALSNFQLAILSHALRFAGARRVVYSTCSIHPDEDEHVVLRVLAKKDLRALGWRLASRDEVLPAWERRGRVEECGGDQEIADSLVRCLPEDGTNGFFVACFVRDVDPATASVDEEDEDDQGEVGDAAGDLDDFEDADERNEFDVDGAEEEWGGIDPSSHQPSTANETEDQPPPKKAKVVSNGKGNDNGNGNGNGSEKLSKNAKKKLLRKGVSS